LTSGQPPSLSGRKASAAIVRSPHAHADIRGIDLADALKMPGVDAVLTGADYRADGFGSLRSMAPNKKRDGAPDEGNS
jgi:aerobic carbon-monoxide dehydrogenase large subunit